MLHSHKICPVSCSSHALLPGIVNSIDDVYNAEFTMHYPHECSRRRAFAWLENNESMRVITLHIDNLAEFHRLYLWTFRGNTSSSCLGNSKKQPKTNNESINIRKISKKWKFWNFLNLGNFEHPKIWNYLNLGSFGPRSVQSFLNLGSFGVQSFLNLGSFGHRSVQSFLNLGNFKFLGVQSFLNLGNFEILWFSRFSS